MIQLNERELIFVFTGPDGSGRKTLADAVGMTLSMRKVLSCTTRERRPYEVDGQDYHFVTRERFEEYRRRDEFLEDVEIDGNAYGILNRDVEDMFRKIGSIYLILNHDGAEHLKTLYPNNVVRIFVYADRETVMARQQKLGLPEAVIARHLAHYDEEMEYLPKCEHAIENIDIGHATYEITNILEGYLQRDLVDKD